MHTFRTTILLEGKTATGAPVPPEIVDALGGGKQPLVHVAIGDYRYRSKVGVRGGRALLPISAEHRAGADVAAGDEIELTLALDTDPREVEVPVDLAVALERRARRPPRVRRALQQPQAGDHVVGRGRKDAGDASAAGREGAADPDRVRRASATSGASRKRWTPTLSSGACASWS